MRAVIINGSIRKDNTTIIVSRAVLAAAKAAGWQVEIVGLESFKTFFVGDYITQQTADKAQSKVLKSLVAADILIFIVPTYYKSMPGVLKNFFDIVKYPEIYAHKRIAVIASNYKNQDYGARHAKEVIEGLLIFFGVTAVVIPEILIQHHEALQKTEIERFIQLIDQHPSHI